MGAPTDTVTVKTIAATQSLTIVALIEIVGPVAGEMMMSGAGAFIGAVIALMLFESQLNRWALAWHMFSSTMIGMFCALLAAPFAASMAGIPYSVSTLGVVAVGVGALWKRGARLAGDWLSKVGPKL